MEEALGVALLVRNRRGVSLAPAGECLLDHARLIVAQVERMKGELGSFARGIAGRVRLLSNTSALFEHLPCALAGFLAANPTISLDVEERGSADIGVAIASGAADVGIASAAVLSDTLEVFPFREDVLDLVLPHRAPLAGKGSVALADVIDQPFVGLPLTSALQRHIASHAARLGRRLAIRARVPSFEAACRMIEMGAGIGIVPSAAAARYRKTMKIEVVKLSDAWARRSLAICVRQRSALPPAAHRLVEHLERAAPP
jgi:DNA-binding transcriptional LysR family regulator